jgi:Fe2+ or Zn2+ uptake regulation protein
MSGLRSRPLERLHLVLLDILASQDDAMSTAQLRARADQHPRLEHPVVHEAVYNALQRLRRSGQVTHYPGEGRHTLWTATNLGAPRQ